MKRKNMSRSERAFMYSSNAYKATHKRVKKAARMDAVNAVVNAVIKSVINAVTVTTPVHLPDTTGYNLFAYSTSGEFVRGYHNAAEAKTDLEVSDVSHIYKVLNGKRRIAFGYLWTKTYSPTLVQEES